MQIKIFSAFASFIFFINYNLSAQIASFINSPVKFKVVTLKCVSDCDKPRNQKYQDDKTFEFGCVVEEGGKFKFNFENISQKPYYYTLVDIESDNQVEILFPGKRLVQEDFIISNGSLSLQKIFTSLPPFGIDKLLLIVSETPDAGNLVNTVNETDDTTTQPKLSQAQLLKEISWILQGQPSSKFKNCFFSVMDIALIPKPKDNKAQAYNNRYSHSGLSNYSIFNGASLNVNSSEKCIDKIKDPQNLYSIYPLMSFMQPLQAGASRGAGDEHETDNKNYVLKGFASALKGIKEVSVNGEKGNINMLTNQQYSWEKEVALQPGKNNFTVNVVTPEGKENCEEVVLNYNANTNNVSRDGNNYSLFIGINNYVNFNKLTGPKKDAADLKELLQKNFGFSAKYTSELYDDAATKENIDSVFRRLISILTPADNLVVYFAGHGVLDKQINEGYWIPVDARGHKPIDYIPNGEIKKYLEAINAKHVVVFADACFSGGFFKSNRGETYADKVDKLRSKWLFCSGREEEVSDLMVGQKNSPFAYFILKFLNEYSGDGLPTSELAQKVKTAVSGNSNQTPISGAIKETGDEGGEFIFRKKAAK